MAVASVLWFEFGDHQGRDQLALGVEVAAIAASAHHDQRALLVLFVVDNLPPPWNRGPLGERKQPDRTISGVSAWTRCRSR